MAVALWNEDVLREVFRHLAPTVFPFSKDDRPGLAALARCARASKALHEPAIDVLWREIDSVYVIFSVLSPRLLPVPTSEAALARFQHYARRVRKLVHRADRDRIQPAVMAELVSISKGEPLFPNLSALYWHQRTVEDVLQILPLASASLRELCIEEIGVQGDVLRTNRTYSITSFDFSQFINSLSSSAPGLETLRLSGNIHASSVLCVRELKQLKTLSIINLAQHGFGTSYLPVLRSCAALSHLRQFGINLATDDPSSRPVNTGCDSELELDQEFSGFHSLQALRVHGSLAPVSRFLSHVSSTELAQFGAFVPRPDRWEDYRGCLHTLSTRFATSLRSVRLSGSWTGNLASLVRPLVVLAPLLHLHQLEDVSIESGTGVAHSLAPKDVATLAKAWPQLRELKLLYQPGHTELPIDALGAFAEHCPRLHTLWLASVDLPGVAERDVEACRAPAGHGLKHIWLAGDMTAADVAQAARFVDRMFPSVDPRPVELPWHPTRDSQGWERLLVCLREVKAARLASYKM
ncbi:hypothetical protein BD413DRAFT_600099 [Trametes elegans]|nr:hypothetical protein BD413DRAFT_600099 [Trametes elegans]